jgi:hypothetical protein
VTESGWKGAVKDVTPSPKAARHFSWALALA